MNTTKSKEHVCSPLHFQDSYLQRVGIAHQMFNERITTIPFIDIAQVVYWEKSYSCFTYILFNPHNHPVTPTSQKTKRSILQLVRTQMLIYNCLTLLPHFSSLCRSQYFHNILYFLNQSWRTEFQVICFGQVGLMWELKGLTTRWKHVIAAPHEFTIQPLHLDCYWGLTRRKTVELQYLPPPALLYCPSVTAAIFCWKSTMCQIC